MAVPVKQESEKKDTPNKLEDHVVSEDRPASGRHEAKKDESVIDNAANLRYAIAASCA